jgi:hypothetical protein
MKDLRKLIKTTIREFLNENNTSNESNIHNFLNKINYKFSVNDLNIYDRLAIEEGDFRVTYTIKLNNPKIEYILNLFNELKNFNDLKEYRLFIRQSNEFPKWITIFDFYEKNIITNIDNFLSEINNYNIVKFYLEIGIINSKKIPVILDKNKKVYHFTTSDRLNKIESDGVLRPMIKGDKYDYTEPKLFLTTSKDFNVYGEIIFINKEDKSNIVKIELNIDDIKNLYYDIDMGLEEIWTNETIPINKIKNITKIK